MSCIPQNRKCKSDLSPAADTVAKSVAGSKPKAKAGPKAGTKAQAKPTGAPKDTEPVAPQPYKAPKKADALKRFETIGEGGYGIVVLDRANNVAIKYSQGSGPAVKAKELELMKKAGELGVGPKVLNDDVRGVAMEFLPGYTTFADLRALQSLGVAGQKQMAKNYFQQLEKLHANGIVHGDMHDGNVMFNPETLDVKILDYTLSRESPTRVGGVDFADMRVFFGATAADFDGDGSAGLQVVKHPAVDAVLQRGINGIARSNVAAFYQDIYSAIDSIDSLPTFDFGDDDE